MATPPIVTCPNCGKKNRIAASAEGIPRCGNCHHALPWIVDATAETFDQEINTHSVLVLVDFWAPWCGPCRMVSPVVERMGHEFAGRLKVVKLNVDEAAGISARYEVQGIPLLVLHGHGQEVDRLVGAVGEPQLRRWLEPHLAAAAAKDTAGAG